MVFVSWQSVIATVVLYSVMAWQDNQCVYYHAEVLMSNPSQTHCYLIWLYYNLYDYQKPLKQYRSETAISCRLRILVLLLIAFNTSIYERLHDALGRYGTLRRTSFLSMPLLSSFFTYTFFLSFGKSYSYIRTINFYTSFYNIFYCLVIAGIDLSIRVSQVSVVITFRTNLFG